MTAEDFFILPEVIHIQIGYLHIGLRNKEFDFLIRSLLIKYVNHKDLVKEFSPLCFVFGRETYSIKVSTKTP